MGNSFSTKHSVVSHACIIVSQNEQLRKERALELAATIVCDNEDNAPCGKCRQCKLAAAGVHPDIIVIERPLDDKGKQKREISVGQIRQMAADAWVLPQESNRKVYVIADADKMNQQAQNAALKILEEPPSSVSFILCAASERELLPTIRSRCTVMSVSGERVYEHDELAHEFLELWAQADRAALCRFCTSCESQDGQRIIQMLEGVRLRISQLLAGEETRLELSLREASGILELCYKAEEYLRFNVSVKHVLGMLCVAKK